VTIDLSTGGYATVEDLAEWTQSTPPDNALTLLRSASLEVAKACNRNPYVDVPSDTDVAPLRDATTAQVAAWVALGVDPAKQGTDVLGPVKSSKILTATIERDTTAAVQASTEAADGLCVESQAILLQAGLLWLPVPLADTTGWLPSWGLDPVTPGAYGWPSLDGASWPFQ
jgi:hypothetical protein